MAKALLATILAGLYGAIGFIVRSILIKFVVFFALWFVTTEFIAVLQEAKVLPSASSFSASLVSLPSGVWYWLDLFAFSAGTPLILSALATRFVIRRIPLIG